MHDWVSNLTLVQVINLFNISARNFPDADIQVSTLDAYFELLIAEAPKLKLPVVTGEMGDTWIYGIALLMLALNMLEDVCWLILIPGLPSNKRNHHLGPSSCSVL